MMITTTTKRCPACQLVKDTSEYGRMIKSGRKGISIRPYCKDCMNQKARERHARKRAAKLQQAAEPITKAG